MRAASVMLVCLAIPACNTEKIYLTESETEYATRPGLPPQVEAERTVKHDSDEPLGKWTVVSAEKDGKPFSAYWFTKPNAMWVFTEDGFTMHNEGISDRKECLLDPNQDPKRFDICLNANGVWPGIYSMDGHDLKICYRMYVEPKFKVEKRPAQFATQPGSGCLLVVLKRAD